MCSKKNQREISLKLEDDEFKKLVQRNSKPFTYMDKPFSGLVYSEHSNGVISREAYFVNGVAQPINSEEERVSRVYNEDGTEQIEVDDYFFAELLKDQGEEVTDARIEISKILWYIEGLKSEISELESAADKLVELSLKYLEIACLHSELRQFKLVIEYFKKALKIGDIAWDAKYYGALARAIIGLGFRDEVYIYWDFEFSLFLYKEITNFQVSKKENSSTNFIKKVKSVNVKELIDMRDQAISTGKDNHIEEIEIYTKIIETLPELDDGRSGGLSYMFYDESIIQEINLEGLYYNRGQSYANLQDYDSAIKDYQKVISLNPHHCASHVYYSLGTSKMHYGDHFSCIEDFTNAIIYCESMASQYLISGGIELNVADIYYDRSVAYYASENFKLAHEDIKKYLEFEPNDGAGLRQLKKIEEALEWISLYNSGNKKANANFFVGAIKDYTKAIKINSNWGIYYNRGNARGKYGDNKGAIEDFSRAIKINSNHADSYNERGRSQLILKAYDLAVKDFNIAIEIDPNNPKYFGNRGFSYYTLNVYDLGLIDFAKAIEMKSENTGENYYYRGLCKKELGDLKGSNADLQISADMGFEDAKNYLK